MSHVVADRRQLEVVAAQLRLTLLGHFRRAYPCFRRLPLLDGCISVDTRVVELSEELATTTTSCF